MTTLPSSLRLTPAEQAAQLEEYRYLHQHPELSSQEYRTADYLEKRFRELSLSPGVEREVVRIGETGVALVLRHGKGPVVGFRADMDALPIQERTGRDYASEAMGELRGETVPVMHGCGHDIHMAAALYAAQVMARCGEAWAGTVVFVMQPAEETGDGARGMVEAGLWSEVPVPEVLFGQHVFPMPAGTVQLTPGEFLAASDSARVTVHGRGGHGSSPQHTIDPIVLGAAMVTRLQTVVAREVSPLESAVVTVGTFHAGLKENVIPEHAEFTLSIRSFSPEVRQAVLGAVQRVILGEAEAAGAPEPEIEFFLSFPPTVNDAETARRLRESFVEALGQEAVHYDENAKAMGSEDFGVLADAAGIPYTFWSLGGFSPERLAALENVPTNHSPYFDPDPEVTLETGTRAAVAALLSRVGV